MEPLTDENALCMRGHIGKKGISRATGINTVVSRDYLADAASPEMKLYN